MDNTNSPFEQEIIDLKNIKTIKIILTGKECDRKISSPFTEAGFQADFIPMDIPLNAYENFNFKHLKPAIDYALANGHDLVIGIDEETNKIGIAVRKYPKGSFILLNVHQLAALIVHIWQKEYPEGELIFIKSFHISEMIEFMAAKGGFDYKNVMTEPGTIVNEIDALTKKNENAHIVGFTENQEFFDNTQNFISIIEKIIKFEEQLRNENKTLFDELNRLYQEFGFYKEKAFVVDFKDKTQYNHVQQVMDECKRNSPAIQNRLSIIKVIDFKNGKAKNFLTNKIIPLNYPSVNMLQMKLSDGVSVSISLQEQQVRYYISMKGNLAGKEVYQEINKEFDDRIFKLIKILNKI
jgi:phosphoglucomutase